MTMTMGPPVRPVRVSYVYGQTVASEFGFEFDFEFAFELCRSTGLQLVQARQASLVMVPSAAQKGENEFENFA